MLKKILLLLIISFFMMSGIGFAEITLGKVDEFVKFTKNKEYIYLSETQANFARITNGYVWISDIEHVIEKNTGEIFLADGKKPYYLAGDIIPKDCDFELFPYHYYDKKEEDQLGKKINYKLIIRNISSEEINVEITGMGTTIDWDHYKTWEGALRGNNKKSLKLKPNEIYTVWEENGLKGDLPWSGIVLGKTSGDIWICDYCYLGEKDPGVEKAEQIPDLAWPPYLLASFTRGTADWNSAKIELFPKNRDEKNNIKVSSLKDGIYSFAFGFSPGGPITKLCEYKVVQPTFIEDYLTVKDPVSKFSHVFFGGNYPIMYKFNLPLINDSPKAKTINFYLCSNDKFNVDTICGIWIQGKMLACRVPAIIKNQHWKVFSISLKPNETNQLEFIVVPLGSRWGGMVASLEISSL